MRFQLKKDLGDLSTTLLQETKEKQHLLNFRKQLKDVLGICERSSTVEIFAEGTLDLLHDRMQKHILS